MFSGIVEHLGEVAAIRNLGQHFRLEVDLRDLAETVSLGESVAVNGVCLTVVGTARSRLAFDVVPETVSRTTFSTLRVGDRVNIERALRVGDRLGGHFVSGHIDGVGRVSDRRGTGDGATIRVQADERFTRYMVEKGSVALDGISLTLVDVAKDSFSIALVPYTLQKTTMGFRGVGDLINVEVDPIGKWVLRYLMQMRPPGGEVVSPEGGGSGGQKISQPGPAQLYRSGIVVVPDQFNPGDPTSPTL